MILVKCVLLSRKSLNGFKLCYASVFLKIVKMKFCFSWLVKSKKWSSWFRDQIPPPPACPPLLEKCKVIYTAHMYLAAMFLSSALKRGIHPPGTLNFNMLSGRWLPLFKDLLRTCRKLVRSETSVWYLLCDNTYCHILFYEFSYFFPLWQKQLKDV